MTELLTTLPAPEPDDREPGDETESRAATVHPTAIVEDGATVGAGTSIWHHAHVRAGATIGRGCNLGKNVYVDNGAVVGDRVKVQNNVSIFDGVTIGDDVFVGPSATFTNDLFPRARGDWQVVTTEVAEGVSIGANATIVCGVTIGRWAMIGAGSVVTRDVPERTLVVGNPARPIGQVCSCGERLAPSGSETVECGRCGQTWELPRSDPA